MLKCFNSIRRPARRLEDKFREDSNRPTDDVLNEMKGLREIIEHFISMNG